VKTLQVQLEPEALGSVTVRMRLSGDQLSVRVDVAEPATLDMIQRERDRLQKSMGSDGVTVGHMEIRALGHAAPAQAGDNAASRQDMNAPGQQQDNQGGGQARTQGEGGDARGRPRDDRRPAPNESSKPHESNHASSNRRGDSRGLYL
jgi:chemotaxis protein MotD